MLVHGGDDALDRGLAAGVSLLCRGTIHQDPGDETAVACCTKHGILRPTVGDGRAVLGGDGVVVIGVVAPGFVTRARGVAAGRSAVHFRPARPKIARVVGAGGRDLSLLVPTRPAGPVVVELQGVGLTFEVHVQDGGAVGLHNTLVVEIVFLIDEPGIGGILVACQADEDLLAVHGDGGIANISADNTAHGGASCCVINIDGLHEIIAIAVNGLLPHQHGEAGFLVLGPLGVDGGVGGEGHGVEIDLSAANLAVARGGVGVLGVPAVEGVAGSGGIGRLGGMGTGAHELGGRVGRTREVLVVADPVAPLDCGL